MYKNFVRTAGAIAVALLLAPLIVAYRTLGQEIASTQESSKARVVKRPNESSQLDRRAEQIRRIRVTADDIAKLPGRNSYLVDLTRPRVVYEFDSKSRPIDFTRITVRSASGNSTIEAWLKKHSPGKVQARWKSARFRLGAVKYLGFFGVRKSGGVQAFNNDGAGTCDCHGDDDCIDMFNGSACIDEGVCIEDDPGRPHCYCSCKP